MTMNAQRLAPAIARTIPSALVFAVDTSTGRSGGNDATTAGTGAGMQCMEEMTSAATGTRYACREAAGRISGA